MKKHLAVVGGAVALMLSGPATADQGTGRVVVETGDCRWLVRHRPAGDVAFAPGVDRRGRPVAPAPEVTASA